MGDQVYLYGTGMDRSGTFYKVKCIYPGDRDAGSSLKGGGGGDRYSDLNASLIT